MRHHTLNVSKPLPSLKISLLVLSIMTAQPLSAQTGDWTVLPAPFQSGGLYDVEFIDENNGWAVGQDAGSGRAVIVRTTNGGGQWSLQSNTHAGGLFGLHFVNASTGYAVGQDGTGSILVLKTTDSGVTWSKTAVPQHDGSLEDVTLISENVGWCVGVEFEGGAFRPLILHTEDGWNWNEVAHPVTAGMLNGITFIDSNRGWAAGGPMETGTPFILHTADGGATWTEQDHPVTEGSFASLSFIDAETGWVCGRESNDAILLKTEDGGTTWNRRAGSGLVTGKGALPRAEAVSAISHEKFVRLLFLSNHLGLVLLNGEDAGMTYSLLFMTSDGGQTWQKAVNPLSPGHLVSIAVQKETVHAVGAREDKPLITKEQIETINLGYVETSVAPASTAGTTTPTYASGPRGSTVPVKAAPSAGWAFDHWVNATPSGSPEATAVFAYPPTQAVAWFKPVLKFYPGPKNPGYEAACPPQTPEEETNTPIIQITVEASPADDWNLSSLTFTTAGSGEADDVRTAKLRHNDKDGQVLGEAAFGDQIAFSLPAPYNVLKAGNKITMMMVYDFEYRDPPCTDELKEFSATIDETKVSASARTYSPGKIEASSVGGGPAVLGCVHNVNTKKIFPEIQQAIDDPATEDTHTILVCPGTYTENVTIDHKLTVMSILGYDKTIVQAERANDPVFLIEKDDTTVKGFTIQGATAEGAAGIYQHGSLTYRGKIYDNKITGNYYGIHLNQAQNGEIKRNLIFSNQKDGIYAETSTGIQIEGNSIWQNKEFAIQVTKHLTGKTRISGNRIYENILGGIELQECEDIGIENNINIRDNGLNGITLLRCDSIKILNNDQIMKNERMGVLASGSKRILIQGNSILENSRYGIEVFESASCKVGGDRLAGEGNHISGNGIRGIELSGSSSKDNVIVGNCIGTDEQGNKAYPINQEEGIVIAHGAEETIIGGYKQTESNVISGNKTGIGISGDDNTIIGNLIGTDVTGTERIGNDKGIFISTGSNNIIGPLSGGEGRNIISGNREKGIFIDDIDCHDNRISGNLIGTNAYGSKHLRNETGIHVARAVHTIIGVEGQTGMRNIISGNRTGIEISGTKTKVGGNFIGVSITGSDTLGNTENGIKLFSPTWGEAQNIIGGESIPERNLISANRTGIEIFSSNHNTIKGNFIGTDQSGLKALGNEVGISIEAGSSSNMIGGNMATGRNVISANKTGIQIEGKAETTKNNKIWGNYIGTDASGNKALGNRTGIEVGEGAISNQIGKKRVSRRNVISGNHVGIIVKGGFDSPETKYNVIVGNDIGPGRSLTVDVHNHIGIHFQGWNRNNTVSNNVFMYNCRSVMGAGDRNTIGTGNYFKNGTCTSTAIHLDGSRSTVVGNTFTRDAGDAIRCENGARPRILKNNFVDNDGYGLNNLDASVTVDARDNWWGHAAGPGSGDGVSGAVDYSGWRETPVSLVISAGFDTLFTRKGNSDTVRCSFWNWEENDDVLQVTMDDDRDWLVSPAQITITLRDSVGADTILVHTVPEEAAAGATNWIRITAVSRSDPSVTDSDSFLVAVVDPALVALAISPDTLLLRAGGSRQLSVTGLDSLGHPTEASVSWRATGGTIDQNGLYSAGPDTGHFIIVAEDQFTRISDSAAVLILPFLESIGVTPDSVELMPGGGQQFSALGTDSLGAAVPLLARWSATGGTVSQEGFYSAESEQGEFSVTVTDTLSGIEGRAVVRIASASAVREGGSEALPAEFSLDQNYPNPFNPETSIGFCVRQKCRVRLTVYDIRGRQVGLLVDADHEPGKYSARFNARSLATGVYFYRIVMGDFSAVKKMVLLE